jgi:hypothetical protein
VIACPVVLRETREQREMQQMENGNGTRVRKWTSGSLNEYTHRARYSTGGLWTEGGGIESVCILFRFVWFVPRGQVVEVEE